MNYAQTYHIGNNQANRTKTTKATVQAVERVCPMDAKTQRCGRGSKRQTQVSTCRDAANGFLKTSFLPRLKETETVQACEEKVKTERDFYQSLSRLAGHYRIEPIQTSQVQYPYNVALAIWDMEEKLKQSVLNWQEIRLVQDSERTYFISEEKYNTGTTLYFIPMAPLFQMFKDPKRKKTAQLLVSECSY